MARKNQRARLEREIANDVLGDDYKFTRDPEVAARRAKSRRERASATQSRWGDLHKTDWSKCVVPGCRFQVPKMLAASEITFPVCHMHAAAAWEDVEHRLNQRDPDTSAAIDALRARREAIRAEWRNQEAEAAAEFRGALNAGIVVGDIYFVRVNGLVKVGYTTELGQRIKAYGAGADLLAVQPGTRQDETHLHRQLTPARAKGREWYHEDDIVTAHIAAVIRTHGPPPVLKLWTEPRPMVAGKRAVRR